VAYLIEHEGRAPQIAPGAFLTPTAVLIGDVRVGEGASVWFGAVLRGDTSRIEIGPRTSVQDNAVVHCTRTLPTIVGADVVVGHGAILEGCTIEDGALVGMNAVVLHRAVIGRGALVAAGAVVVGGTTIAPGVLATGTPATERGPLSDGTRAMVASGASEYQRIVETYRRSARLLDEPQ